MGVYLSSSNTIEVVKNMGCFGGCGYGAGYGMPSYGGTGFNFALIVVLFITNHYRVFLWKKQLWWL